MTLAEYKLTLTGEFKKTNLVFLRRDGQLLLAMKKRGFGAGRWNGAGGKLEAGESFEVAARRELTEELGVVASSMVEVATLRFYWDVPGHVMKNALCMVYVCEDWTGEPAESEEMAPKWFDLVDIPYAQMWADDEYWLPQVLAGSYINAQLLFGEDDKLLDSQVEAR